MTSLPMSPAPSHLSTTSYFDLRESAHSKIKSVHAFGLMIRSLSIAGTGRPDAVDSAGVIAEDVSGDGNGDVLIFILRTSTFCSAVRRTICRQFPRVRQV